MSAATTTPASAAILKAVEEQRRPLINVVSVVRCLKFSEEAGELGGALELIEEEIERVLEALEGPSLDRAAAGGGEEDQPELHGTRAVEAMRTAIDELYQVHRDTEAGSEENKRLWKAAGDIEEVLGAVERMGTKPEHRTKARREAEKVWQLRAQVIEHVKAIEALCEQMEELPVYGICADEVVKRLDDIESLLTPAALGPDDEVPKPGDEDYPAWLRWQAIKDAHP